MDKDHPLFAIDHEAGAKGETLEQCTPVPWPGADSISRDFISALVSRLVAASYRPPELLCLFALAKSTLVKLLVVAKEALARESNVLDIVVPSKGCVHVFGDTHGDLHSLIEGLQLAGFPSAENILCFAGDYVDRGPWGVEVLVVILALKMWQPQSVFLLRGNHETTGCVARYGFEKEVLRKYDIRVFETFIKVFRELPCAAVLRRLPRTQQASNHGTDTKAKQKKHKIPTKSSSRLQRRSSSSRNSRSSSRSEGWSTPPMPGERRVLVVHGGLFRSWKSSKRDAMTLGDLADLADASRRVEDPCESIIEDVLWSDPQTDADNVVPNGLRGAGILFGRGAAQAFFRRNNLHGLVRAHEGCDMRERRPGMADMSAGYSLDIELVDAFVATVFSAARYPPDNPRSNKGAFATFHGVEVQQHTQPTFTQFEKQDYPDDPVLFYNPVELDASATPRSSFS